MADTLTVSLSPDRVEMEPGGTPSDVVVAVQNQSAVVQQYSVEVVGLDPTWYDLPVSSVGLFPGDREELRISLHPPKRTGVRAGSYRFQVQVTARGGADAQSIDGLLDLRGFAVYRLELTPRRLTARGRGHFQLRATNTGTADIKLALEARDTEEAWQVPFGGDSQPTVVAGRRVEVPLTVTPKRRPWIGAERAYDFTVSARPEGFRGDPQAVTGQLTYRPWLRSLGPLWTLAKLAVALVVLIVLLSFALSSGMVGLFGQRAQIARGQVCGKIASVPLIGGGCGGGQAAAPPANAACRFTYGFRVFAETERQLIGNCVTDARYDTFGNGLQYTTTGVLFWLKGSDTVYFFRNDSVYALINGKTKLIDGPGLR